MRRERDPPSLLARAIRLLARRDHSRAELHAKLRRQLSASDDPAEVDRVLDRLERDTLLSDERYAGAVARTRSARFGDARIQHDLKSAGVSADTVKRAVGSLKGTEVERAHALWSRRFGVLPRSAEERGRQTRFLMARGFSTDAVRSVLKGLPDDD